MANQSVTVSVVAVVCLVALALPAGVLGNDQAAMSKLRKLDQFSYGHLVVEGAVKSYEAFRATFGGPLVCGRKDLALAKPLNACGDLDPRDVAGRYVVAQRGECTFVDKAHRAFSAGAAGLIIANSEGGMMRMPMGGQDGTNITIPVVMVNNSTGALLRTALEQGVLLAASLHPDVEPCVPQQLVQTWVDLDRPFFEAELRDAALANQDAPCDIAQTCIIGRPSDPESTWMEGYTAEFGGPFASRTLPPTVVANPPLACGSIAPDVEGKVAVVYRGQCPMVAKARNAQEAGAVAVIIVNEGYVGALRAAPDARGNDVVIPVVMVSADSWDAMAKLPEDTEFAWKPSTAEGTSWDDVVAVMSLSKNDWPEDRDHRTRWLEELALANHPSSPGGHWQRWEAVKAIVAKAELQGEMEAAVTSANSLLAPGGDAEDDGPAEDVSTDLLAPLLSADITHRMLDVDGHNSEVPTANILCPRFRETFHVTMPTFKRGSVHATENHLKSLLRQQLCLEKLLILNAIATGQQAEYLRSQSQSSYSEISSRLLREVKAPHGRPALDVYEALGAMAFRRQHVDIAVTVKEWLSQDTDLEAQQLEAREARLRLGDHSQRLEAASDKAAAEEAARAGDANGEIDEATVSDDGEWSV